MRDAQSALDQVLAFSGQTVSVEDVTTVLGLVGRDLLFDLVEAVAEEDGPRAFAVADRAVEAGHDLRLVCRELARVVRDVMIVTVDPSRAGDGELQEGERARLTALAGRFSREDLMRAFDLLAKAEYDIKDAAHPRYHFEMAMLKWMHLRRLVPLADLFEQLGAGGGGGAARPSLTPPPARAAAPSPVRPSAPAPVRGAGSAARGPGSLDPGDPAAGTSRGAAPSRGPGSSAFAKAPADKSGFAKAPADKSDPAAGAPAGAGRPLDGAFKDALLVEIRAGKVMFYNTVVAQAQSIKVSDDRVTFAFLPTHRMMRDMFEQTRPWLESTAERIAGRKVSVVSEQAEGGATPVPQVDASAETVRPVASTATGGRDLKAEAMSSEAVQAVLDVFPGEIKNVEEIEAPEPDRARRSRP
jgi:DNA polymerase-3 subunit gamma/tau